MPGGRPRKPRALKLVLGTDRPDRANLKAPNSPSVPLPKAPKGFSARQKRAWRELAELVDPMRITSRADVVAFREMARCLAMIDQADEELEEYGRTDYEVVTETGTSYRKYSQVETIATYEKILDAKLSRFGMSPADREKVSKIGSDEADDPLDEFSVADGA